MADNDCGHCEDTGVKYEDQDGRQEFCDCDAGNKAYAVYVRELESEARMSMADVEQQEVDANCPRCEHGVRWNEICFRCTPDEVPF